MTVSAASRKRLKIATLAEVIDNKSGARQIFELTKPLVRRHRFHIFAYDFRTSREALEKLSLMNIKVTLYPYFRLYLLARIFSIISLFLALKKEKPDFIFSQGFLPFLTAAKLSGIPIIRTYYGTQTDVWFERLTPNQRPNLFDRLVNWLLNQIIWWREKISFRLADRNIAISRYTAEEARRFAGRPIPYIYLGADSEFTKNPPAKTASGNFRFLAVSRITPYKNFHLLIRTFRKVNRHLPKTRLIIAGSVSNRNYLKYLKNLTGKSPKIKILTDISDRRLRRLYATCDCYLSADRFSFFGLPPLEAAFFRIPSVVLNYAALPEIVIHRKTGLVAKNEDELVKYMLELAGNPSLARIMGENAFRRAKKIFRWSVCARKYEQIFFRR